MLSDNHTLHTDKKKLLRKKLFSKYILDIVDKRRYEFFVALN